MELVIPWISYWVLITLVCQFSIKIQFPYLFLVYFLVYLVRIEKIPIDALWWIFFGNESEVSEDGSEDTCHFLTFIFHFQKKNWKWKMKVRKWHGSSAPIIGRGHAHFFVGRKEIVVFHLGLGDFWDLVPNKPAEAKNFKIQIWSQTQIPSHTKLFWGWQHLLTFDFTWWWLVHLR